MGGLMRSVAKIWGVFLVYLLVLLMLPVFAWGDISLPGHQSLGDNNYNPLPVSYDQLIDYPFYFYLTEDVSLSQVQLVDVQHQENDSSLVMVIDGVDVGTGAPGSHNVDVILSLTAGLHTLSLHGSCYDDNDNPVSCYGGSGSIDLSIPDLPSSFVEPVTNLVNGDLNSYYTGHNRSSDGVEITGDSNAGINLAGRGDRLYIHGDCNGSTAVELGIGDDVVYIGGDKNATLNLGNNDNRCQIDGNANSGTLNGGSQSDTVKIKGSVNTLIDLSGGADHLELLGNMNNSVSMGNGNDKVYIHGDVGGSSVNMGGNNDILKIDGNINNTVDGGNGDDTLYVNMTEAQWANGWQKNNVTSFETIICTDTVVSGLEEDDFTFEQIILKTDQTSNYIHFMQKYHIGDNSDSNDGYDPTDSNYPYYPDARDATEVVFNFELPTATSHIDVDFYRLRALDFTNEVYVDGDVVGTLTSGGDSVNLTTEPYTIRVDGSWSADPHQLKIKSERRGSGYNRDYDDFCWDEIIIRPVVTTSLVSDYRFDECDLSISVVDSSGNDYHGVAHGDIVSILDAGKLCRGAVFDGDGDYVTMPSIVADVLRNNASMSFWIKTTQTGDDTAWQAPGVSGIEQNGGTDDIFWGYLDASGHIGITVGNDAGAKSTTAINDGSYHHVVLIRNALTGACKVYVDGALQATKTLQSSVIGNGFTSIGRVENTNTGNAPVYLDADLDEVKIYSTALTDAQVGAIFDKEHSGIRWDDSPLNCQNCGPDHFSIEHDGTAINCMPEVITIAAHPADHSVLTTYTGTIELSTSTGHGNWLIGSGSGTLDNGSGDDGSATYTFAAADNGEVALQLSDIHVETVNINVVDSTITETTGSADAEEDPDLEFRDSGFIFHLDSDVDSDINTQICGKRSNQGSGSHVIHLVAMSSDNASGSCVNALAGNVMVEMGYECIDPSGCSTNQVDVTADSNVVHLSGTAAGNSRAYTAVPLDFDVDGAELAINYHDAGKIKLIARYVKALEIDGDGNRVPNTGLDLEGDSNDFVVRPFGVYLKVDGNPAAVDASGGVEDVFKAAGENFTLGLQAVCWQSEDDDDGGSDGIADGYGDDDPTNNANLSDNPLAPNAAGTVTLSHQLWQPNLGESGLLQGTTSAPLTAGEATISDISFSEVGIIELRAIIDDYLYGGEAVLGRSGAVGRFTPHNFDVALNISPSLDYGCDTFTYLGQAFNYFLAPEITITAVNANSVITKNYQGNIDNTGFWKLWGTIGEGDPGFTYTDNVGGASSLTSPTTPINYQNTENAEGTQTLTIHATDDFIYSKSLIAPFDPDVRLTIKVKDDDSIVGSLTISNIGAESDSSIDIAAGEDNFNDTVSDLLRFGRLRLDNAHGSELLPLTIPMTAEYYNGSGFVLNTDDSCTDYSSIYLSPHSPITIGAGETTVSGSGTLLSGLGNNLSLSAPGEGNDGSVDLEYDLLPSVAGDPDADMPWLQYDWDNADNDNDPLTGQDNPTARATFGIYKGNKSIIYLRETTWRH